MADEKRRFDSFEELGRWVRTGNAHLAGTDSDIGQRYLRKYPKDVEVLESIPAPSLMGLVREAVTDVDQATRRLRPPDPADVISGGLGAVESGIKKVWDPIRQVPEGFTSGATGGATKQLGRMADPMYGEGLGFQAGEFLGELWGPYRTAHKLVGKLASPAKMQAVASRFPQLARSLGGGSEAFMVEGMKALIEGDESPWEEGAMAFALGGGFELGIRMGGKGFQRALERMAGPGVDEREAMQPVLDFLGKYDLPAIPAMVRDSNLVNLVHQRITHTQATKKILENTQALFVDGINKMRDNITLRLGKGRGPEAREAMSAIEVGQGVIDGLESARTFIQKATDDVYNGLRKSGVGQVPIDINQVVSRTLSDGTVVEGKMLDQLERIIGNKLIKHPEAANTGWEKKLLKTYRRLREAHRTYGEKVYTGDPPTGQNPTWEAYRKTHRTAAQADVDRKMINSMGTQIEVPAYDYDWWWGEIQNIGSLLDEAKVKGSRKARSKVGSFYHTMQDFIDAQASDVHPNFETIIKQARSHHQQLIAFDKHPLVKAILRHSEDGAAITDPEKVIPIAMGSAERIRQTKALLGPEAFDRLRQGWVRDLLWDTLDISSSGGIEYISAAKLSSKIRKQTGGLDSPFYKEMFSDEGFMDPLGNTSPADTGAAEKFEAFKEFINGIHFLDAAQQSVAPGTEQMGSSMVEKFAIGNVAADPRGMMNWLKGLMAQILVMGKLGKSYLEEPGKNIFLGAKLNPMMEGALPSYTTKGGLKIGGYKTKGGLKIGMSGETRRAGQSAIANRLRGR